MPSSNSRDIMSESTKCAEQKKTASHHQQEKGSTVNITAQVHYCLFYDPRQCTNAIEVDPKLMGRFVSEKSKKGIENQTTVSLLFSLFFFKLSNGDKSKGRGTSPDLITQSEMSRRDKATIHQIRVWSLLGRYNRSLCHKIIFQISIGRTMTNVKLRGKHTFETGAILIVNILGTNTRDTRCGR